MKKKMNRILLVFIILIWLLAFVLIYTNNRSAVKEPQILSDLEAALGHQVTVTQQKDINHSRIILLQDGDTFKYAVYEQLLIRSFYKRTELDTIDGQPNIILANGWHVYLEQIDIHGTTTLNMERWKGRWTDSLLRFSISIGGVLLVWFIIFCVRRKKPETD